MTIDGWRDMSPEEKHDWYHLHLSELSDKAHGAGQGNSQAYAEKCGKKLARAMENHLALFHRWKRATPVASYPVYELHWLHEAAHQAVNKVSQ